jgi:hypothetical protein
MDEDRQDQIRQSAEAPSNGATIINAAFLFGPNGTAAKPVDATAASRLKKFDDLFTVPPEDLEVEERDGATDVPEVGAPGRQSYFRVHPTISHVVSLLKLENTGDYLLCGKSVKHSDICDYRIHLVRIKDGKLKLWPIRLPKNGEDFPSARQARSIAADATTEWTSMMWRGGKKGSYKWRTFPTIAGKLVWPETDIRLLIAQAFEGATVTDPADPRVADLPTLDDKEDPR